MEYILIDLDGTISDSEEGITKSVQYALKHLGIEIDDLSSLRKHIGPPLHDGFKEFWDLNEEQATYAVSKYREQYSTTGIFQNQLYPGIKELLIDLKESGKKVIMATSKPEFFAKKIMEYFDLTKYFDDICGSSMDGTRSKKGDVIRYALEQNNLTDLENIVMIGDRFHDIDGAVENGIASIGVLYGFGSKEELIAAKADMIAATVDELRTILLG